MRAHHSTTMKVRIYNNHPIATMSPPTQWDGKVYEYSGDLLDVRALGAWITMKVGIMFNYAPGHSRVEGQRCVFFPKRQRSDVHCMWAEIVSSDE